MNHEESMTREERIRYHERKIDEYSRNATLCFIVAAVVFGVGILAVGIMAELGV